MKKTLIIAALAAMAIGAAEAELSYKFSVGTSQNLGKGGGYIGNSTSTSYSYGMSYLFLGTATIKDSVIDVSGLTYLNSKVTNGTNDSNLPGSGTSDLLNPEGGDAFTMFVVTPENNGKPSGYKADVAIYNIEDGSFDTERAFWVYMVTGTSIVDGDGTTIKFATPNVIKKTDYNQVTFGAVPEPTSGLLMLLGLAGLALKRRVA